MKKWTSTIIILFVVLLINYPAFGNETNRDEIFSLLQKAFENQLSLTEQHRSLKEVNEILDENFTEEYKKSFIDSHLIFEDEGYIIYGSDVFDYFIPFFSYTDNTKVVTNKKKDKIYVYEYFPKSIDGPVNWDDHYEGLLLVKKNNSWKIADFIWSIKAPTFNEKAHVKNIMKNQEKL